MSRFLQLFALGLAGVLIGTGPAAAVHVHGYTRKDGTHVSSYERHSPHRQSSSPSSHTASPAAAKHGDQVNAAPLHISPMPSETSPVIRDSEGRIKRSTAAKDAFKRQNRCPSTQQFGGPCPGWTIDHIKPLKVGGHDDPSNMQWQTEEDAKAKDKIECGGHACSAR
jgi:hypothetical protein